MRQPSPQASGPVSAADVDQAVTLALTTIGKAAAPDWHIAAGTLEWDCWETVEHMSDDLFSYAAQLGLKRPPLDVPVPFTCRARRPGGPVGATGCFQARPLTLTRGRPCCGLPGEVSLRVTRRSPRGAGMPFSK